MTLLPGFCAYADLSSEATVETFFVARLVSALGYSDSQIAPKETLDKVGDLPRSPPTVVAPTLRVALQPQGFEAVFLERYHDLLKEGGRLVPVIDDSVLGSPKPVMRATGYAATT